MEVIDKLTQELAISQQTLLPTIALSTATPCNTSNRNYSAGNRHREHPGGITKDLQFV
ncbi:hypothetical protein MNBD_GAMMA13-73 [hydrothermal vent metagenome]|uniref:Uncharacterized protein n=1 Tax=hydrothermal vent metagenome TaxID=652676 RepID=A0A3B0Y9U9_9ZZZZ